MTTPIKNITEVANNQVNQYLTVNQAIRYLEAAIFDLADVYMAAGDVALDSAVFDRAVFFRTQGNSVARDLTVPQSRSLFVVQNGGTALLTVKRGTTSITVDISQSIMFYSDGTVNGLVAIAGGGSGGGSLSSVLEVTSTTYDVLNDDASKYLYFTSTLPKTVNVRPNATHSLQSNYELNIRNAAASNLTIVPGSGVTVVAPAGGTLVVPPNGTVTLKRVAVNVFHLMGLVVAI